MTVALRHGEDKARRAIVMVAQSSVLVAFALVQHPRWTAPDTKLDLYVNPLGFLQRALSLWDPTAAAGQLQNQAYGYLFPMGPFFVVGQALGLPAWLVQRFWWAVLLLLGFHGMRLLLSRMGVGSSTSRALAAFAYALSPRMLEGLGAISSEIWPMAIAPWVLVPLVAHPPGGERRAAARSAVAVLAAGAVNAVATVAVLVLPFWWIVTRRGARRWRLAGWWSLFVALASFWWMGPLLLLGRYSPAFLDWIESSHVTAGGASLTEALRGTTQWIAGIRGSRGPQWPSGWEVLTSRPIIFLGLLLILMGLVGIWQADKEWRSFVRGGLLGGLVLVTLGSVRPLASPLAPDLAALLDGALAPLRNTHKFEPSVRIVLCLGIAHALPIAHRWLKSRGGAVPEAAAIVVALAIIGQAAVPALLGVSQRGRYLEVPAHWREAAAWLASHRDGGRTLVLPGATNPASYWGDSRDEPLQPLAESPWMVRDAVPLGSAGATRILNDVEARVASGYGGAELRNALVRLGVTRVLVRSDLDFRATGAPNPMTVRAALRSAGASPTVAFGPQVGGSIDPELALDGGTNQPTPAIAIYSLPSETTSIAPTVTTAVGDAAVVAGGPEGTVLLPDAEQPAVLASDPSAADLPSSGAPSVVLTDTLQRREANFAAVRGNYGAVLRADQDYVDPRRVHDWLMPWLSEGPELVGHQTVAELSGADAVQASSSLANPALGQVRELTRAPESAFDASADTFWESAGLDPRNQWVSVRFADPVDLPGSLRVTFDMKAGADVAAVTVRTDRGRVRTPVSSPRLTPGESERYTVSVGVPPGDTRFLRLTVAEVRPKSGSTVRVRDIGAGVLPRVESWLRLPEPGLANVDRVLMQASPSRMPRCVPDDWGVVQCQPDLGRLAEGERDLRRVFTLPTADDFQVRGTVYPRGEAATARLLGRVDGVRARASSTWLVGPEVTPALLVDGDPKTYWAADPETEDPEITLSWSGERRLSGLKLDTYPSVTGRRVTAVEVTVNARTFKRPVGSDGAVRLPESNASRLVLKVTGTTSLDMTQRIFRRGPAPVVIGDISLLGGDSWDTTASGPESAVRVPCGFGPRLQVNGAEYPTAVSGTKGQVVRGEPLRLRVCGDVNLSPGEQRLRLLASAEFAVRTLSMESKTMSWGPAPATVTKPVEALRWDATRRQLAVEPDSGGQLLVVRENANAGWQATTGGTHLREVTVDGWSQGWVLPAGTHGQVSLSFTPQQPFLATLVLGGLLALVVVAAALTPRSSRTLRQVGTAATWPAWLAVPMTAVALFLLGGATGVLAGAVVLLGLVPRLRLAARTAVALVVVAWIGWAVWQPWPAPAATNRDGLSQLLALVVVAAAVSGVSRQRRIRPTRERGPGV